MRWRAPTAACSRRGSRTRCWPTTGSGICGGRIAHAVTRDGRIRLTLSTNRGSEALETVHGFDMVIDGSGADGLWFVPLLELGLGGPLTGDALQEAIGHDLAVTDITPKTVPFDDENGTFFVLVNDEDQHSLWSAFVDLPAGRRVVFGENTRADCLAFVEEHRTDMRPRSLRDAMALDAG